MWSRLLARLAAAVIALMASLVSTSSTRPSALPQMPTAVHVAGIARIGPLFAKEITKPHGCTGSVVHSRSHDTVLTAAHCTITPGMLFAPGYDKAATPYGVWRVTRVFTDAEWVAHQDSQHDFAILKVLRQGGPAHAGSIEDVTGAYALAVPPRPGSRLVVAGYPSGIDDRPIQCSVTVYLTGTYSSFDCHGYVGGTSGSPWIVPAGLGTAATVVGVIGGPQHGGRHEYTSYTSSFGSDVVLLLAAAGEA